MTSTGSTTPVEEQAIAGASGRPSRGRLRLILGVAAGILAVLLGVAVYWLVVGTVQVPDLAGRAVEQASAELDEASLVLGDVTYDEGASGVPGAVVSQSPAAGSRVQSGAQVSITIAGVPPVAVPDLAELTEDEAEAVLVAVGLSVGDVTTSFDAAIPRGLTASQSPGPGELAQAGSQVALIISDGQQQVAIPSVVGEDVQVAKARLEEAGFRVEETDAPDDAKKGTVVGQEPSGNAAAGAVVTLAVSTGTLPSGVFTPAKGTTLRQELMDSARLSTGYDGLYTVYELFVKDGWALGVLGPADYESRSVYAWQQHRAGWECRVGDTGDSENPDMDIRMALLRWGFPQVLVSQLDYIN